jgi:hypothetical protein
MTGTAFAQSGAPEAAVDAASAFLFADIAGYTSPNSPP